MVYLHMSKKQYVWTIDVYHDASTLSTFFMRRVESLAGEVRGVETTWAQGEGQPHGQSESSWRNQRIHELNMLKLCWNVEERRMSSTVDSVFSMFAHTYSHIHTYYGKMCRFLNANLFLTCISHGSNQCNLRMKWIFTLKFPQLTQHLASSGWLGFNGKDGKWGIT